MGCIFSQTDHHIVSSRTFHVYNVDDHGAELNPGWIEVGDTDLILHQRGKESIRWPLRCLRRYGFDAELFSFESGRRCPTGPGIYAFKCRRAEELFNLVQECIQRVGQEDHNRVSRNLLGGTTRTNSRPSSLVDNMELNGFLVPNPGSSTHHSAPVADPNDLHLYQNGSVIPETTGHEYINTGQPGNNSRSQSLTNGKVNIDRTLTNLIDFLHDPPVPQQKSTVSYATLDLPKSTEDLSEDNASLHERWGGYRSGHSDTDGLPAANLDNMNYSDLDVFTDVVPDIPEQTHASEQHNYINVGKDGEITEEVRPEYGQVNGAKPKIQEPNYANLALQQVSTPPRSRHADIGMLNYIQVDVDQSSSNTVNGPNNITPTSPVSHNLFPDSPNKRTESYAMIDFDRTAALSNFSRVHTDEDGPRKTRHNSTISDVLTT